MRGIPGAGKYLSGYVENIFEAYIENTPEQIAAFIMDNEYAATKITNQLDVLEVETTFGSFVMSCANQHFLQKQLLPVLVPMQRREAELIKFIPYEGENL